MPKHRHQQPSRSLPTPEDKDAELRRVLHKDTYDELVRKQISNAENSDRHVLTLSSSALGLSLAFIKDIAPLDHAYARWMLIASWCLFGVSVIATMISFLTSQSAIRLQMAAAERYYVHRDETALNESLASKATTHFNLLSGIAFIAGIALTIEFVVLNLPARS